MTTRTRPDVVLARRQLLGSLVGALMSFALVPAALAAQAPGGARTRPASTPKFSIDLPEKDWRLLPGGLQALGCVAHKDDGVVLLIEHELLQIALTSDEIDGNFADLELAELKEHEPAGSAFTSQIAQVGRRRMVMVDFERRGSGGADHVRVYVLLQGRHLYRLVCVAPSPQFTRYAPAFQAMVGSFTALGTAG